jgi:hypothetical protein
MCLHWVSLGLGHLAAEAARPLPVVYTLDIGNR